MLKYFNDQKRGWTCNQITKDDYGNIVINDADLQAPTTPVVVTNDNIFLPYPEKDLLQNPRLKEEPQSYNFNK